MAFVFMAPKARAVAKSRESEEALERLQECLKQEEEEPVEILEQFWRAQAAVLTLEELSEIFQAQKIPQKLLDEWRQDYMGLVNDKLKPVWDETMDLAEEAVEEAERSFAERQENVQPQKVKPLRIPMSPKVPLSVQQKPVFTQDKEYILRWIKTHGSELVTNCTDEQKEAIRALTLRAVNENMSSAEFARYIRPTIGLTRPQAEANMKLYQTTKEMLQKEYPRMKPENVEKRARKAAENYAKKQIRQRAETIARTEIARAYNYAMDEIVRRAIAEGRLPEMKRVWSTSQDGKVCPTCQAMEGMEVSMDGEFRAKQGKKILIVSLPPAHPRCACAVKYVEREDEKKDPRQKPVSDEEVDQESMAGNYEEERIEWPSRGKKISSEDYKEAMKYARKKEIELSGFKNYDGSVEIIREIVDDADSVLRFYPELKTGKQRVTIMLDEYISNNDFAITNNHIIRLNANAFRDTKILSEEYRKLVDSGWFVKGTDYHSIVKHEIGHVVANRYGVDGMKIALQITEIEKKAELLIYLQKNLSDYSASIANGGEIIAECFSAVYNLKSPPDFALRFIKECGKLIKRR